MGELINALVHVESRITAMYPFEFFYSTTEKGEIGRRENYGCGINCLVLFRIQLKRMLKELLQV